MLLRHVLQLVLEPLADAVDTRRPSNNLELVLDHFWDNRRLARALMAGRPRRILQERLAEMIESNLRRRGFVLPVPLPMAASCIAHGQVAMLDSWLAGRDTYRRHRGEVDVFRLNGCGPPGAIGLPNHQRSSVTLLSNESKSLACQVEEEEIGLAVVNGQRPKRFSGSSEARRPAISPPKSAGVSRYRSPAARSKATCP